MKHPRQFIVQLAMAQSLFGYLAVTHVPLMLELCRIINVQKSSGCELLDKARRAGNLEQMHISPVSAYIRGVENLLDGLPANITADEVRFIQMKLPEKLRDPPDKMEATRVRDGLATNNGHGVREDGRHCKSPSLCAWFRQSQIAKQAVKAMLTASAVVTAKLREGLEFVGSKLAKTGLFEALVNM
ncbi:uncharacterized protein CIMG_11094 [Coccidioides immitis RS]|uniref:Uncharacterized protein n=1 Tax=Coccidioides immitis (strain RS) TaxID=246410 RepID=A0A0D8JWG5_COCIM|nr:uncharacterized protein CIMG_11094 [Coccidioides immitis RS]KJF61484.1 hypothetical protein CIMG_11094 [Coccidioides immitis RS]